MSYLRSCDEHVDSIVVHEDTKCPFCEAEKELANLRQAKEELQQAIVAKDDFIYDLNVKIEELKEELEKRSNQ
jgi:peptidoglycan hydrolase CwlO-like protein